MAHVFSKLREMKLLVCEVPKQDYKPKKYDPKAQCVYHMGQFGHSIEHYWRLKHKVQDVIDAGFVHLDLLEE